MERAIHKRDAIALKHEPSAKKSKQQTTAANLKLCTQASTDAEQKMSQREAELGQLQQTIEQAAEDSTRLEREVEELRSGVQVNTIQKQRNLANLLRLQRAGKRCEDLAAGQGVGPPANVRQQMSEQLVLKKNIEDVIRVVHDAYPQLEAVWGEYYSWLDLT